MRLNHLIFDVVSALAIAGAAVALRQQHQAGVKLKEESSALQQQVMQLTSSTAEHDRLSNMLAQANAVPPSTNPQLAELARLRRETAARKQQIEKLQAAAANGSGNAAGSPGFLPLETSKFAGYATPESAIHSMAWAMNQGDLKTFLASCTPEMAKQMTADLRGVTEEEFASQTMEKLKEEGNVNLQILNTVMKSDDEANLTVYASSDSNPAILNFKRIDGAWKFNGPETKLK
jgi:hypothetical protein